MTIMFRARNQNGPKVTRKIVVKSKRTMEQKPHIHYEKAVIFEFEKVYLSY